MEDKDSNFINKSTSEKTLKKPASCSKQQVVLRHILLLVFRIVIFGIGLFVMYYLFFVYLEERNWFLNLIFFSSIIIGALSLLHAFITYSTKIARCIKKDNPNNHRH